MIGSRWVPGGSIVNWPRHRELLSRGGNFYTRTLLGIPVRDATAGYRLFRRTTLERIDLDQVESPGYVFQADLAFRTLRAGLRVVEVPIEFVERERGESKMSRQVATESLKRITRWGLSERVRPAARGLRRPGAGPEPDRGTAPAPPVVEQVMTARRRRFPWGLLVAAFILVPLVEIYVIIQIGQVIGAWWTILLLIADSILGLLADQARGRPGLARRCGVALERAADAAPGARRRRADPGRRHADADPGLRHRHLRRSCASCPFTRPIGRRVLAGVISRRLVGVSYPTTGA